jgi:hypothetical protein
VGHAVVARDRAADHGGVGARIDLLVHLGSLATFYVLWSVAASSMPRT